MKNNLASTENLRRLLKFQKNNKERSNNIY